MFSIGEFSKITGLTVKTLRFYHEQGVLTPSYVEAGSGYRFYAESKIETARVIAKLRELEFSIADIKQILSNHQDDDEIIPFLQARRAEIRERQRNDRRIVGLLDQVIHQANEVREQMDHSNVSVEEKTVEPIVIASIRMTGRYSDCGSAFAKIGRKFGRHLCGRPMMLCHDGEYREDDADFEVAMPVRKGKSTDEITVRELPGGDCISLVHLGPYEDLRYSYEKLLKQIHQRGFEYDLPTREVYLKGPGMIFRGNPKKYVTEIQLMAKTSS